MNSTRTDIINHYISKHNYSRYLEIGIDNGANFAAINCHHKVGVDPEPSCKATWPTTSNQFFRANKEYFDCIFIDGLHHADQVVEDVQNALQVLTMQGTIIIHDCLPTSELHQLTPRQSITWTGDVWKAWVRLRQLNCIQQFVIDTDWGCGIIQFGVQQKLLVPDAKLTWDNFCKHKQEWMNIVTIDQWKLSEANNAS